MPAGGWDIRGGKPNSTVEEQHAMDTFIKVTFNIPKTTGKNLVATFSR